MTPSRSLTATPADSCPRCWSAKRPKAASGAASWPGAWIPTTPHIALALLFAWFGSPAIITQGARQAVLPGITKHVEWLIQVVGHARAAILRRPRRCLAHEPDEEPVTAGLTE